MPETLARTRWAVGTTLRRPDARLVFAGVTLAYLALYLFAVGHLGRGDGSVGLFVVGDPLTRALRPVGTLAFEPVARVDAGPVTLLFSPFDTLVGLALAVLVGLNLAVTYLAWTQPRTCGLGTSSAGLLAAVPALLSGAACCGPVLLVVLGIQASGLLLATFSALVPLAALLLVGTLLLVGRRVDPAMT
ncbi:hypothetical protein ACFQH6_03395 [Halobacteriaceae archaeon GCM10025711]